MPITAGGFATASAIVLCALMMLGSAQSSLAATQTTTDGAFVMEFSKRWTGAVSEDSDTLLNLSAANGSFTLTRLEEKPDAEQLADRLQKELMSLRAKGYAVPDTPVQASNHHGARLIYALYQTGTERVIAGFLIMSGKAFAVSAVDMYEDELLSALQTFRRKGEPLELATPAEPPQKRAPRRAAKEPALPKTPPVIAASKGPLSGEDMASLIGAAVSTTTAAVSTPVSAAAGLTATDAPPPAEPKKPLFPRGPLPLHIFVAAAALWSAAAAYIAWRIPRPPQHKNDNEPAELPSDYNFPYNVHGKMTASKLLFFFSGRDGLVRRAEFNCLPEKLAAFSAYALLAFEFGWSCLDMVGFDMQALLLALPGGAFFSAMPEFVFMAALAVGLVLRNGDDRALLIKDMAGTPLYKIYGNGMAASVSYVRGNELGRLSKNSESSWTFYKQDGSISFELLEKDIKKKNLRKIFGGMGGLLDARYDLHVKGQPAGSVTSAQQRALSFTVDFSSNFYTSVNKECLMSVLLFVKAIEQDCLCPWA